MRGTERPSRRIPGPEWRGHVRLFLDEATSRVDTTRESDTPRDVYDAYLRWFLTRYLPERPCARHRPLITSQVSYVLEELRYRKMRGPHDAGATRWRGLRLREEVRA